MKRRLYVIYDTIAEDSGPVFEAVNDGVARRYYDKLCAENMQDPVFKANDYQLICVGIIDKTTFLIDTTNMPVPVEWTMSLVEEEANESV